MRAIFGALGPILIYSQCNSVKEMVISIIGMLLIYFMANK